MVKLLHSKGSFCFFKSLSVRSCTCSDWSTREHAGLRFTTNMPDFHQSAGKHLVRKEEKRSRRLCASWGRWWQRAVSLGCSCDHSAAEEKTFADAIAHHDDRKVAHGSQRARAKHDPHWQAHGQIRSYRAFPINADQELSSRLTFREQAHRVHERGVQAVFLGHQLR